MIQSHGESIHQMETPGSKVFIDFNNKASTTNRMGETPLSTVGSELHLN